MDYEKYKEALERAKKELNTCGSQDCDATKQIFRLFPELAESEDERIRKELTEFLKNASGGFLDTTIRCKTFGKWVAWLEKQCKIKESAISNNEIETYKENNDSLTNEDERIRKGIIDFLWKEKIFLQEVHSSVENNPKYRFVMDAIAWLEKQNEQKPIMNVPSREVILSIWDLGNEWKELTNGSISTEYGTQLDYIQKHWHESEYYLREKQDAKKVTTIDFNAKDWYVSKVDGKIHNINISSEKQGEKKPTEWSEDDERIVTALMEGFRYHQLFNPRFGEVPNAEIISWIKSLKERLS